MFAIRLASASTGISYPYLYLNSAASDCARCARGLASAIDPGMTHPTDGEIWKMWETDEGSSSLSCAPKISPCHEALCGQKKIRTGTFFCDKTTAQSLPRRPTDMMFAAVAVSVAVSVAACSC